MLTVNEELKQLNSEFISAAHRFVRLQEWQRIKNRSKLVPKTQIAPDYQQGLPAWSREKYIFAIDEKDLKKWRENKQFPNAMEDLINHVKSERSFRDKVKKRENYKVAELSFNFENTSEAYVLDYAYKLAALIHEKNKIAFIKDFTLGCFGLSSKQWKTYIDSRVSYAEYNDSHCLPELAISKPIDINKIRLERIID